MKIKNNKKIYINKKIEKKHPSPKKPTNLIQPPKENTDGSNRFIRSTATNTINRPY